MKNFMKRVGIIPSNKKQFVPNSNPKIRAMRDMLEEGIKPLRNRDVFINLN